MQHAVLGMQARVGSAATSALVARAAPRRVARAPRTLQRFDIDDRSWKEVTTVTHLSKGAYEVSTSTGASLVIKLSASG